jgi:amino acid transporter
MNDSKKRVDVEVASVGSLNKQVVSKDEEELNALGYRQDFKREFGFWSTFSISFALLALLPGVASTLDYCMGYAGTAGMSWGWVLSMIGVQAVACSMAELCSAMPTSGGLYYASAVLAPAGWGPLVSWITGWSNWICLVTSSPAIDYALANMMLSLKMVRDPSYHPQHYQVFLLTTALMIVQSIISSLPTKSIGRFNLAGTWFNGTAAVVAMIVILAANNREGPKFNPTKEVWGDLRNSTDWPDGVAILMSFMGIIWAMSGYDAPFHLSEETSNSNMNSPRAIVWTSIVGGVFGWALQLTIAYTCTNVEQIIDSSLGQPFVTYLQQVVSDELVFFITSLTIVSAFFAGQASMISASRVVYAYSRDGCFPVSRIWARVNKHTLTPVNAVWFNTVIGVASLLLLFAGDIAIGAIFSVGAIGGYVAFTLPVAMKVFFARDSFRPGPWNLGKWSRPTGFLSVGFILLMAPILCFPEAKGKHLNPQNMNWTALVYFGPMGFSLIWYAIYARHHFKGPKVSVAHAIHVDGLDFQDE